MTAKTVAEMIDLLSKHTNNGLFNQEQYNSLESLIIQVYLNERSK